APELVHGRRPRLLRAAAALPRPQVRGHPAVQPRGGAGVAPHDAQLETDCRPVPGRPSQAGPPAEPGWAARPKVIKVAAADLKEKVGLYHGPGGLFHRLVLKDGRLSWVTPFQHTYPLLPLGPTRFRSPESPVRFDLEFTSRRADSPDGVTLAYEEG